jgi:hypothetical protein
VEAWELIAWHGQTTAASFESVLFHNNDRQPLRKQYVFFEVGAHEIFILAVGAFEVSVLEVGILEVVGGLASGQASSPRIKCSKRP